MKKALCIGINDYPGTNNDLSGCVNDAKDWSEVLQSRGYQVQTLLDSQATKKSMIEQMTALISGAQKGDTCVLTYSGHGSWLPDADGDESDGRDEMLCPWDIASQQYLMDDDLAKIFSKKHEGARALFISDSCHSGSVSSFAESPLEGDQKDRRARLLPPQEFVKNLALLESIQRLAAAPNFSRQKYPALLLSGCKDVEVSWDATFNGKSNGALTRAAIDALKSNPATPKQWYDLIRKRLPSMAYPQTPQLFGSTTDKNGPLF